LERRKYKARQGTRDKERLLAVEWHRTNLDAGNVEMTTRMNC